MIVQQGYEIDSQGNIGNETRRIEDLQLRFILLMAIIPLTIKDGSAGQIAKQARAEKEKAKAEKRVPLGN